MIHGIVIAKNQFVAGLISGLAKLEMNTMELPEPILQDILENTYNFFKKEAENRGFKVDFELRLYPIHGDGQTLIQAIYRSAARFLVVVEDPLTMRLRLKITPEEADLYLNNLPGGPELYLAMAARFKGQLEIY